MRFGVIQFPGSCDERDALAAASLVGEAVLLWHRDHDLQGADAVIVPGGFSYGDYLRAGGLEDGVYRGNFYLRGGGDPTFGSASFNRRAYGTGASVTELAAEVAAAGVERVTGT